MLTDLDVAAQGVGEVVQTVEQLWEGRSVFRLSDPAASHDFEPFNRKSTVSTIFQTFQTQTYNSKYSFNTLTKQNCKLFRFKLDFFCQDW